ncbi:bifunctional DNA primase/polymerase, partial [Roseivivax isoporae]|uniref:bifunctional DNA primase/polymerase n=1 Tax=Roseivivax isoporae TaxID=591206 RepID=UPI0005C18B80
MSIFANTAPAYWAAGLAVIPLIKGEKRPAIARWQNYSERLPDEEEKAAWLRTYPNANIGLVLGAASGVIAVDIDTTDPVAVKIIERVLPPSPWRRVGAKGSVRLYRYNGERTLRLQAADGMVAEILSTGSQVVLPPSIHPDTQRPYTANIDLLSVLSDIPDLPLGVPELLRKELLAAGVAVGKTGGGGNMVDFVPAGQRDTRMTSNAGMLARAVIRDDRTLIEALDEMRLWVEEKVDQIVGDPLPLEKSQLTCSPEK